jgi:hypothetical protein
VEDELIWKEVLAKSKKLKTLSVSAKNALRFQYKHFKKRELKVI